MTSINWVKACEENEISDGDIVEKHIDGLDIVLMRNGEQFFAAQAICPHMDEKLCNGLLKKSRLICTKHLWQWDLETGNPLGAAEKPIQIYKTSLKEGVVYVSVDT
ncbi:Rieske (2Fe-2S) protein [Allopusillimonas ginsengisoli]|uniref:Rieske (2Fe-2S) protein n=1 Tax=Allopusillimonas ginsengisoli TaxID=453575 RepID=UPI00101EDB69|nr:Rieske 2Fe-2S domain-containing protein [Allopusillimonas ginsengisoli]TEA79935.1 ferredoxin [Allopusillimonas ginsengisoli]